MKKFTGYRLHIEAQDGEPTAFRTMAEVRAEQIALAKEYDRTVAEIKSISHIITEEEYQADLAYKAELAAQRAYIACPKCGGRVRPEMRGFLCDECARPETRDDYYARLALQRE